MTGAGLEAPGHLLTQALCCGLMHILILTPEAVWSGSICHLLSLLLKSGQLPAFNSRKAADCMSPGEATSAILLPA